MRHLLIILSLFLFSFTIISCGEKEEEEYTTDTTAPVIAEVTAVTTPSTDTTPDYTFSSDEAGTITYGGSCSSSTTSAISGNNTITLVSLSDGTYSDCTITVTDTAGNVSNALTITSFTISIKFVAVGNSGTIITSSTNGTSWVNITSGDSTTINGITYGNSTFVAVAAGGKILTSTNNGASWEIQTSTTTTTSVSYTHLTLPTNREV